METKQILITTRKPTTEELNNKVFVENGNQFPFVYPVIFQVDTNGKAVQYTYLSATDIIENVQDFANIPDVTGNLNFNKKVLTDGNNNLGYILATENDKSYKISENKSLDSLLNIGYYFISAGSGISLSGLPTTFNSNTIQYSFDAYGSYIKNEFIGLYDFGTELQGVIKNRSYLLKQCIYTLANGISQSGADSICLSRIILVIDVDMYDGSTTKEIEQRTRWMLDANSANIA